MKKLIVLYIVLCLVPLVAAELELDEIKVYINDGDSDERRIRHMEDEDEIELYREEDFAIKVELDNNMNNRTKYYLWGRLYDIDDGDDITERQPSGDNEWIDIDANDYEIRTLSFDIPSDVSYDDYRFDFYIYYKYDDETIGEFEYDNWEVIIEKDRDETEEEVELEDVMKNMSTVCSNVISQMTQTFDYINKYDNVSRELSTCKEERGTYKTQASDKETTLIQCRTDRDNNKKDFDECDEKKKQMISRIDCDQDIEDEVRIEVDKAEKKQQNTIIGLIIGAGVLWWFVYKRKKGISVHDTVYKEKIIP